MRLKIIFYANKNSNATPIVSPTLLELPLQNWTNVNHKIWLTENSSFPKTNFMHRKCWGIADTDLILVINTCNGTITRSYLFILILSDPDGPSPCRLAFWRIQENCYTLFYNPAIRLKRKTRVTMSCLHSTLKASSSFPVWDNIPHFQS